MTTTVTVKTAGHAAFVNTVGSYPWYTTSQFFILPGTTREFTISESTISIEEKPIEIVYPQNTHASVV